MERSSSTAREYAKALIAQGARLTAQELKRPLWLALHKNDHAAEKLVTEMLAALPPEELHPLLLSAIKGIGTDWECARVLFDLGARLTAQELKRPLWLALHKNYHAAEKLEKLVTEMLAALPPEELHPLLLSEIKGIRTDWECARVLFDLGARLTPAELTSALMEAISHQDNDQMKLLKEMGARLPRH